MVASITDLDTLGVSAGFTHATTGKAIGVFKRYPKGGINYTQNNFPTVTVSSSAGTGANIQIDAIASDGEELSASGLNNPGAILAIKVLVPGEGYQFIPTVTIPGGDGNATANAEIERTFISSDGRWITSDSILSTDERKIQGRDYYVKYSYIVSSEVEFFKYKQVLKDILRIY